MAKMQIGIMGGSFNPIHTRHMELGATALKEFHLDKVLFIPTGNPPHKKEGLESAEHRFRMTELSIFGMKNCSASRLEIDRDGVIYTVDTLRLLHEQYPNAAFYYIIGQDTLNDLPNWHTPDQVFPLCKFLVCSRSNADMKHSPTVKQLEDREARFSFMSLPPNDVSSTRIRNELKMGLEPRELTPQVSEYIHIFGLYQTEPSPKGIAEHYDRIASTLSEKRLVHSLLVSHTARRLARIHGIDEDKATLAALLHDSAKCLPLEEMRSLIAESGIQADSETLGNGNLLHGHAGSVLAKKICGITDPEILAAIQYHTTGRPGMSKLEMLIFLADKIEPSRKDYSVLQEVRKAAFRDLEEAMRLSLKSSIGYVHSKNEKVHYLSEQAYQWLLSKK